MDLNSQDSRMRPETGNSDSHEPERPSTKRMASPTSATAADMDARTIIEGTTAANDADTGFTLSTPSESMRSAHNSAAEAWARSTVPLTP